MNNSNVNNIYNEATKDNFVVMYNNVNLSNEKNVKIQQVGTYKNRVNSREIIEYTDDVAEQVRALYEKITINLEEYYRGIIKINDVNNRLKQYYKSIKNYCIKAGIIDENNEAYKNKILIDIYRNYRHNAVIAAVNVNDTEGKNYSEEVAEDSQTYYVYYNSNYYYECEKLREMLTEMVHRLAIEEKIGTFDTESIDKRKRYVYDYGFNYAWVWNNNINMDNRVDLNNNLIPPRNMKVFYQEYLDSKKDNKLILHYEDNMIEMDPTLKSKKGNNGQCYIFESENTDIINNNKLVDFLNTFCILANGMIH